MNSQKNVDSTIVCMTSESIIVENIDSKFKYDPWKARGLAICIAFVGLYGTCMVRIVPVHVYAATGRVKYCTRVSLLPVLGFGAQTTSNNTLKQRNQNKTLT